MPKIRHQTHKGFKLTLFTLIVVRLIIPLIIFINPAISAVLEIFVDTVDGDILRRYYKWDRLNYQVYDKYLDFWWYIAILIFSVIQIHNPWVLFLIIVFFLVRLAGQIIFVVTKSEEILLYFPNVIEPVFLVYLLVPDLLSTFRSLIITTVFLIIIKVFVEYWIHIWKFSLGDIIRRHLKAD